MRRLLVPMLALCLAVPAAAQILGVRGDFNYDGIADIAWRFNEGDGGTFPMPLHIITYNNGPTSTEQVLPTLTIDWRLVDTGDFDGDGKADLLWRNYAQRDTAIWFMEGRQPRAGVYLPTVHQDWRLTGTGDFNGDGRSDLLWVHRETRQSVVWLMNGGAILQAAYLSAVPGNSWEPNGIGDFNGDGKDDIFWHNHDTRSAIWYMDGAAIASSVLLTESLGTPAIGDFDGDGDDDFIVWGTEAKLYIQQGGQITAKIPLGPVTGWVPEAVGDYDGDGDDDVVWESFVNESAYTVWYMSGAGRTGNTGIFDSGLSGSIVAPRGFYRFPHEPRTP